MLVLSRKEKESFLLGENIEITILEISGDKAKIAINAPKEITILRKELLEAKQANIDSAASVFSPERLSKLKLPVKNPANAKKTSTQDMAKDPAKKTSTQDAAKDSAKKPSSR